MSKFPKFLLSSPKLLIPIGFLLLISGTLIVSSFFKNFDIFPKIEVSLPKTLSSQETLNAIKTITANDPKNPNNLPKNQTIKTLPEVVLVAQSNSSQLNFSSTLISNSITSSITNSSKSSSSSPSIIQSSSTLVVDQSSSANTIPVVIIVSSSQISKSVESSSANYTLILNQ